MIACYKVSRFRFKRVKILNGWTPQIKSTLIDSHEQLRKHRERIISLRTLAQLKLTQTDSLQSSTVHVRALEDCIHIWCFEGINLDMRNLQLARSSPSPSFSRLAINFLFVCNCRRERSHHLEWLPLRRHRFTHGPRIYRGIQSRTSAKNFVFPHRSLKPLSHGLVECQADMDNSSRYDILPRVLA